MAAGMGSRYGGLKQIEPIGPNGEIIMDYSIYDAINSGFGKIVFVIKKEIEQGFKNKIGKKIEKVADVGYVYQELTECINPADVPAGRVKPWGTGHAVLCCRGHVNTPFAVINADDFYGKGSFQVLAGFLKNLEDSSGICNYGMVGFKLSNTLSENGHVSRGVCEVSHDGYLKSIVELSNIQRVGGEIKYTGDNVNYQTLNPGSIVSLNTWGFTPSVFDSLEDGFKSFLGANKDSLKAEFFLPDVVDSLIKRKIAQVKILYSNENWYGVTYKEDRAAIAGAIKNYVKDGLYPENLWGL
jgi:dTDP-glucose pyrophosphorylase